MQNNYADLSGCRMLFHQTVGGIRDDIHTVAKLGLGPPLRRSPCGAASCNRRRPTFVTAIRLARPRSPTWTSSIQPAESIRFTLRVRLSDPGDETARSPPDSPGRSWQLPVAARTAARRCRAEHIQRSRCIFQLERARRLRGRRSACSHDRKIMVWKTQALCATVGPK